MKVTELPKSRKAVVDHLTALASQILLLSTGSPQSQAVRLAEQVYPHLLRLGYTVTWDDTQAPLGSKLELAQSLSANLLLVISARSIIKGGIEVRPKGSTTITIVPQAQLDQTLQALLTSLP